VPERIDLDCLARARGDNPVAESRVHPRQLDAGLSRPEQAVASILLDSVTRAFTVEAHGLLEHGEQLLEKSVVLCGRVIRTDGLEVPERCVHRVVLGRLARVGETGSAACRDRRTGRTSS